MQHWGNDARVFLDGRWSDWMPVKEAQLLEQEHWRKRIAALQQQGKRIIVLSADKALLEPPTTK